MRATKKEIEARIAELCDNEDNFTSDNYGSEAADNGHYEVSFSRYSTEKTLREFAHWILHPKEKSS
jgi:hypothetical protein